MTFEKLLTAWTITKLVSPLFKKPIIIDGSNVPSPRTWLRRWCMIQIPLRV
jgi:hypothetical protein